MKRSIGWKRLFIRVGRVLAIVWILALIGCSMFQEQLLFPGHASQGSKDSVVRPADGTELVPLQTSRGDRVFVLFGKAINRDGSLRADSNSRPTIIFFYGNAMSLSDTVDICLGWRKLGANVISVEYPGYGMSSGKPSEAAFYAAADAAYDYAASRADIDKNRIISTGLSLGTGVAVDLASRKKVAGLALLAPFTSMDELAHRLVPWLPTSLILQHHFRSDQKIAGLTIPILIIHGNHDGLIPVSMSHRMAAIPKNAQVTTLFIESDHNDMFALEEEKIDLAMAKLIEQVNESAPSK